LPRLRGSTNDAEAPILRPFWGYFVRRLHRLDQGERLAALTLMAVCLFNVYEFINVG
jgi:hypothetical protein